MTKLGLYVHIPFCHKICRYCDFVKMAGSLKTKQRYLENLMREFDYYASLGMFNRNSFSTIYLGGGTPSNLELPMLEVVLKAIVKNIDINNIVEFTIEANPEDINLPFINLIKRYGINRISIGVQSFNSNVLRTIGRNHDYEDLKAKIALLKENGLTNINLDFMFGFKQISLEETIKDLTKIISLNPTHISCYSLILEEKTILYHEYLKGNFELMDEEVEEHTYHEICHTLNNAGYLQYEISNFAKEGYQSIHNLIYWSNERYLGIGLGSSSYLENRRFKNVSTLKAYNDFFEIGQGSLYEEEETLSEDTEIEYEIIMRLRLRQGIDLVRFKNKFNKDLFELYPNFNPLLQKNYLIHDQLKQQLFINPAYIYLTDFLIKQII